MTEPAGSAPPVKDRPHERRIKANCELLAKETNRRERDKLEKALYEDLFALSKNLLLKQLGYSQRIDADEIAHSVASSALMTIILRDKPVFSWVQLIRKMTSDWANKWMRTNIYDNNKGIKTVDIDEVFSDDDGDQTSYQIPHYDMGADTVHFFFSHLKSVVDKSVAISDRLATCDRGRLIGRLAIERALYGDSPLLQILPAYQAHRVKFYSQMIRRHVEQVVDPRKLERALF